MLHVLEFYVQLTSLLYAAVWFCRSLLTYFSQKSWVGILKKKPQKTQIFDSEVLM